MFLETTGCSEGSALADHPERIEGVIGALTRAVAAKDRSIGGHLQRSARYAGAIGGRLGLYGDELIGLRRGAVLHDIGKVCIDEAILRKAGPLTPAEYHAVQRHTIIGEQIVLPLRMGKSVASIVRHHHERWDGSGYPDGLAAEAIPFGARIVAVADAFDAMTTQRPYNQVFSFDQAIATLCEGKGIYWDTQIVKVFVEWLQSLRTENREPRTARGSFSSIAVPRSRMEAALAR
jgi:HD-GYP domain-containing protein (c-di-GMP phosphodiesterase class II)